jgi:hypothetical protein
LSEKGQKWLFGDFSGEFHSTGNPEELQKYPMKIYGEGL